MSNAYQLTAEPVALDLGALGRAAVFSTVPFLHGTAQHCAHHVHVIEGGHHSRAVLQALGEARAGVIRVWPK